MLNNSDALILLARILLMALFLITGWQKLTNFSGTEAYMKSVGTPLPKLATIVSIIIEFFVGIALVIGLFTRPFAVLYIAFVLATTIIGHHYWTLEGADRRENELMFFKNVSIIGGLLLLVVTGPGKYALMS